MAPSHEKSEDSKHAEKNGQRAYEETREPGKHVICEHISHI